MTAQWKCIMLHTLPPPFLTLKQYRCVCYHSAYVGVGFYNIFILYGFFVVVFFLIKVPDCKNSVAFSNMLMYFTLHRVHLTNNSLAIGLNCKKMYMENIWRNIYLYSVGNDGCLFSVSHLMREFRFLKCLICSTESC